MPVDERSRPAKPRTRSTPRSRQRAATTLDSEKSQAQVATAIGRNVRWVRELTEAGVFVRIPSSANPRKFVYPWPSTLERWIEYSAKQQPGDKSKDATRDAQARAASADAAMKEFRLEQMRGEWVRRETYSVELRRILSAIVGILDVAPGKYAHHLPGDLPMYDRVQMIRAITRDIRAAMRGAGSATAAAVVPVDDSPRPQLVD